ncbi:hypothetical protein Plhal304r1_c003g0011741 [Plasmopara halstedii]
MWADTGLLQGEAFTSLSSHGLKKRSRNTLSTLADFALNAVTKLSWNSHIECEPIHFSCNTRGPYCIPPVVDAVTFANIYCRDSCLLNTSPRLITVHFRKL